MVVGLELDSGQTLQKKLESAGFTVLHAANEREAALMTDLHEGSVQVVIADQERVSEAARRDLESRINRKFPNCRFLYLCDHAAEVPAERGFLRKPFQIAEVVDALGDLTVRGRSAGAWLFKSAWRH